MADTLDILTLAEGKDAVNIDTLNTDHDDELAQHITAVSRIIDAECGPVVVRTVTAEIHSNVRSAVVLRQSPVTSVTTVREAAGGTINTLTAVAFGGTGDGYYASQNGALLDGVLHRRYGGAAAQWEPSKTVEVTYVAGRYATTATVDARFKTCAASILRRLWKRESGTWAQSPDFFENTDGQGQLGFYRVAKPIIDEMLHDQLLGPSIA